MNTQNLLDQYFETAFSAPDGIKRLRELILSLAMQGKLVPQDPNDQPARELLQEIEAEKEQLIRSGKIKKQKPLPEIKPEEILYDLPESWEWVRLGDIGIWQSGSTPSRSNSLFYDGDIPWVKSGEVKQGRIFDTEEKITNEALEKCSLNLNPIGSVLIAMYGANIGEVGILEVEATTNQAICACQTFSKIDKIFLTKLLTSLKSNFVSQGAGAAQPNISRIKIVNTVIPLPPLTEQKRIVEKGDRLMEQCEKLEQLQKEKEQKRILIHTAAREKLLTAKDQETFGQAWDFIKENFGELYAVKDNVTSLRQAILQLAVMGKLVPQDPNDPPASELLKEIEAEKQRLIKEGKLKKQKPLPEIKPEEIPYDLPENWEWVRLIELGFWATGSGFPNNIQGDTSQEILMCKVSDMNIIGNEKFIRIANNTISEELALQKKINIHEPDTIIFPKIGGAIATNKRRILIKRTAIDNNCLGIKPHKKIYMEWMYKLLESFDFSQYQSGTSVPAINQGTIGLIVLGLPPIAQQKRIVEKVDRLMEQCDKLEQLRIKQQEVQTALLNSIMAKF